MRRDPEGGILIELSPKQGAVVLAVVAVLWGWRMYAIKSSVEIEAADDLRNAIRVVYAREYFGDLEPGALPGEKELRRRTEAYKAATNNISFASVKTHGTGEEIIVRVEILVDGEPPPDGVEVRYFLCSYSAVAGWICQYEVSKWRYWMGGF